MMRGNLKIQIYKIKIVKERFDILVIIGFLLSHTALIRHKSKKNQLSAFAICTFFAHLV